MSRNKGLVFLPDFRFRDDDEYERTNVDAAAAARQAMSADIKNHAPVRTVIMSDDGTRPGPEIMTTTAEDACLAALEAA